MPIRAIIFDLDGTLADTLDGIVDSLNSVLGEFGLPTHERDAYRRFIGDGVHKLVERALPDGKHHLAGDVLERYLPVLMTHGGEASRPYEGTDRLLDALTRSGTPFSVLSNKPHEPTVDVVARLFGGWRFAEVAGAKPSVPIKPDPTAALALADRMGVPANECAFVGDSDVDMETATNAGMIAVGAAYGLRGRDELQTAGARHLIDTPEQLIDLLD